MKKLLKYLLILFLIIILLAVAFVLFLTVREFKPAPVEELEIRSGGDVHAALPADGELSILSWNIGYCALGQESDFFMDGGKSVRPECSAVIEDNLEGISEYLDANPFDLVMLQEVDTNSHRSYSIDQCPYLSDNVDVHALNYSCDYVPFPWPPIGKVHSGLLTTTDYRIASAQRISLPCPFSWPVSAANLKRCLLVSYLPIENSDKHLVLVNLHLEAYDDGEGKIAQTKQLNEFIQSEYEKGNYVIAGGDFNQSFPGSLEAYPNTHPELWEPGILEESSLPEGWSYVYDNSVPTCRLLNQPYDPNDAEGTQHYVIDGFIVSPNVTLKSVETVDMGFEFSDHNPVKISVTLE